MPSVPTYIRNSDWEKYMAVRAKGPTAWAEHIHESLRPIKAAASSNESFEPEEPKAVLLSPEATKNLMKSKSSSSKPLQVNPKSHTYLEPEHVNFLKKGKETRGK